jgi:GTP cyclohydrolase I
MEQNTIHTFTSSVREMLRYIGEDVSREGLKDTPERVRKAWLEMFSGYGHSPGEVLKSFEDGAERYDEMIVLKDVEFTSFCEHHILPFSGVAHVAYLPRGRIVGLSKLARLVEIFAKRLQVQERLTQQIATSINQVLGNNCRGAACVVEASHSCMACRGVKKQNAVMVTSCLLGSFRDDPATRAEFLNFIRSK